MSGSHLFAPFFGLVFFTTVTAQPGRPSAWDELLGRDPAAVEDESITWRDRLVLNVLTPGQAELYFSGRADSESLRLEDGRTLADYLEARLSPRAQAFIPLASPCSLFSMTADGGAAGTPLHARAERLDPQGGAAGGCGIPEEASAVLLEAWVRSLAGTPARLKVWAADEPEPPFGGGGETLPDLPLAYERTLLAPLCAGCPEADFELRTDETARASARALGYFRPLATGDAPGGGIRLSTEGSSNNFFGTSAGSSNTTGVYNSFFGAYAGDENTGGDLNSFFGAFAGSSNDTGNGNSMFGAYAGVNSLLGNYNSFFGGSAGESNAAGDSNSFFGHSAGENNYDGSDNSFFGRDAGNANTSACCNSFFGYRAGYSNTTGQANAFFGHEAGLSNTTASDNSFFGDSAGYSNTTGDYNSFFGEDAGYSNTTASENAFFGGEAGYFNTTGVHNCFFGHSSGFSNNGYNNSFFGYRSGLHNVDGFANSFFGHEAGLNNTEGVQNAFFGRLAGQSNTTESGNTFIGAFSDGFAGIYNATAIGYKARVSNANSLVLGGIKGLNGAAADVSVGIGTDKPRAPLHVKRTDGTAKMLVEEASLQTAQRPMLELSNNGGPGFRLTNSLTGTTWFFSLSTGDLFQFSLLGTGGPEFLIYKDGRVQMGPGPAVTFDLSPIGDLTIAGNLTAKGFFYPSDHNLKENLVAIDGSEVLDRLARLPIASWNYRSDPATRHVGPMAQDFEAAFGVGSDGWAINAMDEAGVTLAALKGLHEQVREYSQELARQREENRSLRERVEALERLLGGEIGRKLAAERGAERGERWPNPQ